MRRWLRLAFCFALPACVFFALPLLVLAGETRVVFAAHDSAWLTVVPEFRANLEFFSSSKLTDEYSSVLKILKQAEIKLHMNAEEGNKSLAFVDALPSIYQTTPETLLANPGQNEKERFEIWASRLETLRQAIEEVSESLDSEFKIERAKYFEAVQDARAKGWVHPAVPDRLREINRYGLLFLPYDSRIQMEDLMRGKLPLELQEQVLEDASKIGQALDPDILLRAKVLMVNLGKNLLKPVPGISRLAEWRLRRPGG